MARKVKDTSERVKVTKDAAEYNRYKVEMYVTQGKILSIINALEATPSPVGEDVLRMLKEAYVKQ